MKFVLLGCCLILNLVMFAQEPAQSNTTDESTLSVQTEYGQQKVVELERTINKLAVEVSSVTQATLLLLQYYSLMSQRVEEMIRRYDELINLIISSEQTEVGKEEGSRAVAGTTQTSQPTTQYVRVKVKDKGQELEFNVDPSYVDVNLEMKRDTSEQQAKPNLNQEQQSVKPKQQKDISQADREELLKYIESSISSLQRSKDVIKEIPKEVLDDLYLAQKLFYKKQYREALKVVQRSLSKQETAIGCSIEGSLYFVLGDIDAAISSWNRALELDPNLDDVREALYRYTRSRLRR